MNGLHLNMFVNGKDIMGVIDTMGGRLMLARKDAGLNQLELLERLKEKGHDITPAHWSRVEGNKRGISLELLTAVADILGQSLDYLTGRPQFVHEVTEQFLTEEATAVARLLDSMDEDHRKHVLAHAQHLKRLDEERKALHREIATLLIESLSSVPNGTAVRAKSVLDKINVGWRELVS